MVYRRRDNKTGKVRPGYTFMARTQTGWKQMGSRTDNKTLAGKIEGMWETLAKEHRAWDILGRVMSGELPIGALYDLWSSTRWDVHEIRRRLNDPTSSRWSMSGAGSIAGAGPRPTAWPMRSPMCGRCSPTANSTWRPPSP